MQLRPLPSPLICAGDNLAQLVWRLCADKLTERSVICVSAKVVAVAQGRTVDCADDAEFAQLVAAESDEVLDDTQPWTLSIAQGCLLANAGIDRSNAPAGKVILLPTDTQQWCNEFVVQLCELSGLRQLGVLVTDSATMPLRRGLTGVALAWAGFIGVSDERGKRDLYGRKLKVSHIAVADNLASAAQIYYGQADERVPFVVVSDCAALQFTGAPQSPTAAQISRSEDLFAPLFNKL